MRLIDADALIDRIKNPYEQAQVARWVNEQPTIEPEKRTEKRTETHACDCISRQAAIESADILFKPFTEYSSGMEDLASIAYNHALADFVAALNALPSAERLEVQSSGCEYWDDESNFCTLHRPSAERRGRWIELYKNNYKCSVCGSWWTCEETPIESGMSYCPNCGAKMDGEEG